MQVDSECKRSFASDSDYSMRYLVPNKGVDLPERRATTVVLPCPLSLTTFSTALVSMSFGSRSCSSCNAQLTFVGQSRSCRQSPIKAAVVPL